MNRRAVFLDLNGTIAAPIFIDRLSDLKAIDGAAAAIANLTAAGFVCPVVTVQARIAKGYFTLDEFQEWFTRFAAHFREHGAEIVGPYVCPHRFAQPCACKKPNTVLYEAAAAEHDIDLRRSFLIGDSAADVEAAHRFGGRGCLVRTGWGADERELERARAYASHIAECVTDAADWVLRTAE